MHTKTKAQSWIEPAFRADYQLGQKAAMLLKSYLESRESCKCIVANHSAHTYDLAVIRHNDLFSVEIKAHSKSHSRFPAEIYAHGKLSEYLQPGAADYVVQVQMDTGVAYWFIQSDLREYVLARMGERNKWKTGAEGILIDYTCKEAGYWRKTKLNE